MTIGVPYRFMAIGASRDTGLTRLRSAAAAALAVFAAGPVAAESSFTPTGFFAQIGAADDTTSATAGLTWRWNRQWSLGSGVVTGYWAAALAAWRYPTTSAGVNATLWQGSFTPVLRYTGDGGRSDWFVEGGIGLTYMNRIYSTQGKTFSTRFNFGDQIALGVRFGPERQYEASLRFEHFSNARIDTPNPGENFVQFRLAVPLAR